MGIKRDSPSIDGALFDGRKDDGRTGRGGSIRSKREGGGSSTKRGVEAGRGSRRDEDAVRGGVNGLLDLSPVRSGSDRLRSA